ncbi:unnamed protein product [Coregonus sp. 'balchen']|nr:unnamed protein product [Coregonus sp. 'balchen']
MTIREWLEPRQTGLQAPLESYSVMLAVGCYKALATRGPQHQGTRGGYQGGLSGNHFQMLQNEREYYTHKSLHNGGRRDGLGVVGAPDPEDKLEREREGWGWGGVEGDGRGALAGVKRCIMVCNAVVNEGGDGGTAGDERGLLGLTFHPNYKKNGKLYVSYTTNQERWAIGPHDHILRVVEYTVSRKNPNVVDSRTTRMLIEVAELHRKHLGGQLLFGPDGLLHIVLGDGMITLDDMEEMDGLSDFTGSVLRVDVDTDCCTAPYSIPRNNPYFNSTNQPPEIFAHGLHDPGRCAVDRHYTDNNGSFLINEASIFDLATSGGAAPVGGFIYRGCQSRRLYGSYVFGDKNGNLRILQKGSVATRGQWQEKALCLGTSSSCEVYILATSKSMAQSHSGKLYKLVDPKRPAVPKECQRQVEAPELLGTACSRQCKNGYCTPTGKCCCSTGWEGPFCRVAKCEPACRNGGVCVEPNKCLCKSGYSGAQCEKGERGMPSDQEKDGILDHIIDMTSYLLNLTSYIV